MLKSVRIPGKPYWFSLKSFHTLFFASAFLLLTILARESLEKSTLHTVMTWGTTFFGIWVGRLYADWMSDVDEESEAQRKLTAIRNDLVEKMREMSFAWRNVVHAISVLEKKGQYDVGFVRALQQIYGNQRLDFEKMVHAKADDIAKLGGDAEAFSTELMEEFKKHREIGVRVAERLPYDDGHLSELNHVFDGKTTAPLPPNKSTPE